MQLSRLTILLALVMAAPLGSTAAAADISTPAAPAQVQSTGGYLGVLLGPVPDPLRAQLESILPPGQGVMIRDVVSDSPAAKAGLRVYDILTRYNDQKIFSAEQLTRLVRADSPDTIVTLHLVRDGTAQDAQVTLGQADVMAKSRLMLPRERHPLPLYAPLPGIAGGNWDTFDSMSLKKLEDGNFKAEIQYFGKDGKLVKQGFTGTREAIREQLMEQPDLPPAERNQLLAAISARDDFFPPPPHWITPLFVMPPWFNNWQPDF
jgi:membrane-associated protease RseP (regulator of RpoE activity)